MLGAKPGPESTAIAAVWEEAELRERLLERRWARDLEDALRAFYADEVLQRITVLHGVRNPFAYACGAMNTLFDDPPTVTATAPASLPGGLSRVMAALLTILPMLGIEVTPEQRDAIAALVGKLPVDLAPISTPELWSLRHGAQLRAIAKGGALMRIDVVDGRIRYRVVALEAVEMEGSDGDPGSPVLVRETLPRCIDGVWEWTRETWSIAAHHQGGLYRVEAWRKDGGGAPTWVDVTSSVYDSTTGPYPYKDAAGPILPYVLIHDEIRSHLYAPFRFGELVSATLAAGCLHTFWLHGVRDAANAQPVAMDCHPVGMSTDGASATAPASHGRLMRDPSVIWQFHSRQGHNGSVVLLGSSFDPLATAEAIDADIAAAYRDAGLGPTDEAPAKGVSGKAIQVSREALRRSQRHQRPAAQQADQKILATAARLANAYCAPEQPLPTDPSAYSLEYHGISLSTDEVRATVERARTLLDAGLTERWRAIREAHPHLSEDEARAMAARIEGPAADAAPKVGAAEAEAAPLPVTPTDVAIVVTVNEVRQSLGLGPLPDGHLTVAAYKARNDSIIAAAALAEQGDLTRSSDGRQGSRGADPAGGVGGSERSGEVGAGAARGASEGDS